MLQNRIEPDPVILLLVDDIQGFGNPLLLVVLQERTHGSSEELAARNTEPLGELFGRIEKGVGYRDGGLHNAEYNKSYTFVKRYFDRFKRLIPKRKRMTPMRRTPNS